jgi:hypothetical protein
VEQAYFEKARNLLKTQFAKKGYARGTSMHTRFFGAVQKEMSTRRRMTT